MVEYDRKVLGGRLIEKIERTIEELGGKILRRLDVVSELHSTQEIPTIDSYDSETLIRSYHINVRLATLLEVLPKGSMGNYEILYNTALRNIELLEEVYRRAISSK